MALLNRMSRLFRADLNAVLDQIEEPEQILKQAIREMEDELSRSDRRIACCKQEQETLQARIRDLSAAEADLERELDLCFETKKDDLAKSLIRRKLLAARTTKRLVSDMQTNERYLERETRLLEENRTTLEGLRQKAEIFLAEAPGKNGSKVTDLGDFHRDMSVTEDEIEIAFLREQAARSAS